MGLEDRGVGFGGGGVSESLVGSVRDILGFVFIVGARIAAPVVLVLLLIEIGVGLIARSSPALSFMIIGYPRIPVAAPVAETGYDPQI